MVCIIAFAFGYYALNYMAVVEKPFIGRVFLIIVGISMMAISFLIVSITAKNYFFPKKRRRSRHVFLEDQLKNKNDKK